MSSVTNSLRAALGNNTIAAVRRHNFGVKTSPATIEELDLAVQRLQLIPNAIPSSNTAPVPLPLQAPWIAQNPVQVIPTTPRGVYSEPIHYHVGGLPALMQAARKLEELQTQNRREMVVYVTDANMPKTMQSGHQGHVHPSEWTAAECTISKLMTAMAKGAGFLRPDDPADVATYSYLHFPINFGDIVQHPTDTLKLYGGFFWQRIVHNLTSTNGVSREDRWVCNTIAESLAYHQKLSDRIEAQTGDKTFQQQGRVYWSPNLDAMKQKQKTWKELGIECEFIREHEIMERTLLKADAQLHVLYIHNDGKFYPHVEDRIKGFLQHNYPNFICRTAALTTVYVNKETGSPFEVVEVDPSTGEQIHTPTATFFGSLGHSEVHRYDAARKTFKPLWSEVPVSGISSVWRCEIDKSELCERFHAASLSDEELQEHVEGIVAAANLSNLHVTSWDCSIGTETVELIIRASQGANFNSFVAEKSDLKNMAHNLNKFFIGDWTLISAGTCTRKTWVSNVPEVVRLGQSGLFLHGLSGLGFSFSGAAKDNLDHK